ncbi:MAG: family 10 glycosylhydrolase [Eubacteriales bacterium]|nr:family 10 glycosylhydrolase [Eubacteriales bacterium]
MIKRIISLLLTAAAVIITASPIISITSYAVSKSITYTVDGENCGRGDGELIVYTRSGENTGTNVWGYEVRVDGDGKVISVGGNNSVVPENGLVVSGHNSSYDDGRKSASFLSDNVSVGDYIVYNSKTMLIIITDERTFPSYDITVSYNAENTSRGTNMTVVYSSGTATGTNEWGYEVCVDGNGLVVSVGGNNNNIPAGGYVVSGHNTAGAYLEQNVLIGMSAAINRTAKTVTFTYTAYTMYKGDESRLDELYSLYDEDAALCAVVDYESAYQALQKASDDLEAAHAAFESSGDYMTYLSFSDSIGTVFDGISAMLSESVPVEYRGVWIRPTQTTREQVAEVVQQLYDNGINTLCIETLYNGYMIMPMPEDSLFEQNPAWAGFDMLEAFIEECHARQMELHLWMPVFYVGHTNTGGYTVYDKKPEWRLEDENGNTTSDSFLFLNPCNEEVQDFLIETYEYILSTYDADGFQLDYIRFPDSSWGFNDETVQGFYQKTGITVTGYVPTAAWWKSFCEYRASFVTEFVGRVRAMIDEVAPGVILSADTFPSIDTAVYGICQDSAAWIRNGWMDLIYPMAYGVGSPEVYLPKYEENSLNPSIACGLGAFEGSVDAYVYLHQIRVCRSYGCLGQVAFESSTYLNKSIGEACVAGPYSVKAVCPSWDKTESLVMYTEYIKKRINETLVYLGCISEAEAASLSAKADEATALFGISNDTAISSLKAEFEKVSDTAAKAALLADAEYLRKINLLPENDVSSAVPGDANGDGKLTVTDYISVRLHILGIITLDGSNYQNADIDSNGVLNVTDYIIIRLKLLGIL